MADIEREPVIGIGIQHGPLTPRYGPGWAPLQCDICNATWVGPIGENCEYCLTRIDNAIHNQRPPPPSSNGDTGGMAGDGELSAMLIDWPKFWARDHSEAEWLAEPLIPAGRSVALFAPGGTGKSLLALWLAVCIATGQPIFGRAQPARRVLYLDYEMTEDDLAERLETMGYADADLTNLRYALLPSLPGLDQREGGEAVLRLAELSDADLVIIDTFGRAVHGDENDADTVRAWYRWTGIHLKHAGRAFLRVDHAGKDLTRGQRGTSAKNDDVDVVWQMTIRDDSSYSLIAKKRRMGWVPETVNLHLDDTNDLTFTLLDAPAAPAGTVTLVEYLDELDAPLDISTRQATQLLRDHGHPTRRQVIVAAVKHRRDNNPLHPAVRAVWDADIEHGRELREARKKAAKTAGTTPGTDLPPRAVPDYPGTFTEPKPNPLLDDLGTDAGTYGNHRAGATDGGGFPRSGEPPDGADPNPNPLEGLFE